MKKLIKYLLLSLLSLSILNVSALNVYSPDYTKIEKPVVFELPEVPEDTEIKWSFGDNNFDIGKNSIHRYNDYGKFTVTAKINDYLGIQEFEKDIYVIEKSAAFITDINSEKLESLKQFGFANNFYLDPISSNDNLQKTQFIRKNLVSKLNNIDYIIIWTTDSSLDFFYSLSQSEKSNLISKDLIFISEEENQQLNLIRRLSNIGFKNAIITSKEALYYVIELKDYNKFIDYIESRDYKHTKIEENILTISPFK